MRRDRWPPADAVEPYEPVRDWICCYFLLHWVPDPYKCAIMAALLERVAGGGAFSAFVTLVMILVTGFGLLSEDVLSCDRMMALFSSPWANGAAFLAAFLAVFLAIFLAAWHAAHRLYITAHDLDGLVTAICYGLTALATVTAAYCLLAV